MPDLKNIIKNIEKIQTRLIIQNNCVKRDVLKQITVENRGMLITGARGVGKTTWMLSQLSSNHFLYFSADNPIFSAFPLYDLAEAVFMEGYEGILIDEVHYSKDWAVHLKSLYDSFPNKIIIASDSNSIALKSGVSDLSRRFFTQSIPLLSFREYLMLKTKKDFPKFDPYNYDLKVIKKIMEKTNVLLAFKNYIKHGLRPFFLESEKLYSTKLLNTVRKSMEADIPFIVPGFSGNHLRLMNAVIGFLAVSKIPLIQVNSLCNKWAVGKEKLYQLLDAMERAHIIRTIRKKNDTKIHSIGAKLFLHDVSVYNCFLGNYGTVREAYVANISMDSGRDVFAAGKEKDFDFLIDSHKVEVGGKNKNIKNADFVIRDDTDIPFNNVIPLWMLGFEY